MALHCLPAFPAGATEILKPQVIYGRDDRKDLFEVSDPGLLSAADGITLLADRGSLCENDDGTVTIFSLPLGPSEGLCEGEPFFDQPAAGFCSGFLVDGEHVATAGHCVAGLQIEEIAFVFGYRMLDPATPVLSFPVEDVYYGAEIVSMELVDDVSDWAVVRLDRPVSGRSPLDLRRSGTVPSAQPLVVIGHPLGLPLKVAEGARVVENSDPVFFQANLDTFGGNSGSPVLNRDNLLVEGILVRGPEDFEFVGDCLVTLVCPDSGCSSGAEDVTRATRVQWPVDWCAGSETINCWDSRVGRNDAPGSTTAISDYACTDGFLEFESGPEFTYEFIPPGSCLATVSLSEMSADLDLFVLEGGCRGACIVSSAGRGNERVQFVAFGGREYYVVVDGFDGAVSQYRISVACEEMEACAPGEPIACGEERQGRNDAPGSTRHVQYYACDSFLEESGPEYVYTFTAPADGEFSVALTDLEDDLDLFVLEGGEGPCDGSKCVALSAGSWDEAVTFCATKGSAYFLVVDGYWDAVSSYTIKVSCNLREEPRFVRGDVDGDGKLGLADAVLGLFYIFSSPQPPVDCVKAIDFDDSGKLGLADIVALLLRVFARGGNPLPPYPGCGTDPTEDVLPCEEASRVCR